MTRKRNKNGIKKTENLTGKYIRQRIRNRDLQTVVHTQTDRPTDGRTDRHADERTDRHYAASAGTAAVVPSAARHRRPSRASPATVASGGGGGGARSRRSSIRASGSLRCHPVHPPLHQPPPTFGCVTSTAAAVAASASANLYTGAASKSPGSRERSWTQKQPSPPPPHNLNALSYTARTNIQREPYSAAAVTLPFENLSRIVNELNTSILCYITYRTTCDGVP
ncbi:hypothetical protein QTP88_013659 [Uroleucon formosanum]